MKDSSNSQFQCNPASRRGSKEATLPKNSDPEASPKLMSHAFQIRTLQNGYNSGRIYYYQVDSQDTCIKVMEDIKKLVASAKKAAQSASMLQRSQNAARKIVTSPSFQISSALIICMVSSFTILRTESYMICLFLVTNLGRTLR